MMDSRTIVVEAVSENSPDYYLAGRQNIHWHEEPNISCVQALPIGMEAKPGDHVTIYSGRDGIILGYQINDGPVVQ